MRSGNIRVAAVSGAVALLWGLTPGLPEAWAEPPATCDGLTATIVGTDGDDTLTGTSGDDVVSLGAGDDHFDGGGGNDVVCGGSGRDVITLGDGDDRIFGGDENDLLVGGRGDDMVDGGNGDDVVYGDQLGGPRASGLDGVDQVLGGPGDDTLELVSGDGFGNGGADHADGGDGTDLASYESSPVGVTVDVGAGVAHGAADDTLTGFEAYRGSNLADTLLGTDGPDVLDALEAWGDGGDRVAGGGGDDLLTADQGTIRGGAGDDVYRQSDRGTAHLGVDLGRGRDRAEITQGSATSVRGGRGDDTLAVLEPVEGRIRVRVDGARGQDLLTFAGFGHRVRVDAGLGKATGRALRLRFSGVDQVDGTRRDDVLVGSRERDRLSGLAGDDVLRGRRAGDLLVGGPGLDTANGGPGADVCEAERRISCREPG